MNHIFISYSRRDLEVARKIVNALKELDLDTWLDWESILKGEAWEQAIYRGIEEADVLLFLVSPDSIQSEMCNKELVYAISNNKRILPVLLREVKGGRYNEPVAERTINELNWIFCRDGQDDFAEAMTQIQRAVRTDFEWVRQHTSLLVKARAWEQSGRDGSRLLRGRELREAESRIAGINPDTDPCPTELQRQYLQKSRQAVRRRQSLPYAMTLALAGIIFVWGKFYFLFLPVSNACPVVGEVTIRLDASDPQMPAAMQEPLLTASKNIGAETSVRDCGEALVGVVDARAEYDADGGMLNLYVSLPDTPAYQLDFLQEIRSFGPELASVEDSLKLLQAFSAYAVGEYQTAIDETAGIDTLGALTLTAQAQLFMNDLDGSRKTYTTALGKQQTDAGYTGRLYTGAALAWWRPQSYYELEQQDKKEACRQAGTYYRKAQDWAEASKMAQNIRVVYAWYCVEDQNPDDDAYLDWKTEPPQTETDLTMQDAAATNAIAQYILALRDKKDGDQAALAPYHEHLAAAQALMLARADLSASFWGSLNNCSDARTWRDAYRAGLVSEIEKRKYQRLLKDQPLRCP